MTSEKVIVSGHQRIRACVELGIEEIYCEVRIYENEDRVLKDLIETNIRQRGTIGGSDLKMGRIIKELERIYGIRHEGDRAKPQLAVLKSQEELASEMGMSLDKLQRLKKLAELPKEFQDMLESGKISTNTATSLIAKLSEEEQIHLFNSLPVTTKLTQSQMQKYINDIDTRDKEISEMKKEMVEQQRAINAATDSQEYLRMKKAKEEADCKLRI